MASKAATLAAFIFRSGEYGRAKLILKDNVVTIEPANGSAMVLFGLRPDASNAQAMARIGPNLFAAWSGGRGAVFCDKAVLDASWLRIQAACC
jgi:hypothetical protein